MRQLIIFLLVCFCQAAQAQTVGIGTTTPNASAQLDVTSTTKGLLLPRMTSAQRIAIVSPAAGLVVYETTTNSIWVYNGTGWVQQASGGASPWTSSGTNIFNTNSGRVGIGTSTPAASAELDISSTTTGLLVPRMTTLQRTSIASPAAGLLVYDNSLREFYHFDGNAWRQIVNSLNNLWKSSSVSNFVYNTTDSIGIGTTSPAEKLQVVNGSVYLQDNRSGKDPHVFFDVPLLDGNTAGMQFKRAGDTLGAVQYVVNTGGTDYLRLSMRNAGTRNDLTVNTSGEIGVGTNAPAGQLQLSAYTGDNLLISDADGIIQLSTPQIGSPVKKAFIQLANGNDLRLGTNSGNTTGNIVFRMDGNDLVTVEPSGEVGIDTPTPLARLHIATGNDADLNLADNGYVMMGNGSGSNMLLDNNEIMVRTGYLLPGTLTLQNNGGELVSGARLTIKQSNEAITLSGATPFINFNNANSATNGFISQTTNSLFIGENNGLVQIDGTQVAIGAVNPAATGYKLTVTGKVICEEVKVKLSSAWPDYVFRKEYQLPTLSELERYIRHHEHLPGIPAASQLEKEGLEVGDMQSRLLKKVEELTLYVIDLQKQVDELRFKK